MVSGTYRLGFWRLRPGSRGLGRAWTCFESHLNRECVQ